ncbi:MAG: DUF4234 domain-containing protein [Candidatus Aenigmatarchaeota archaeon]
MIRKIDPLKAVIFAIITLGIYGLYWFYKTSKDLIEHMDRNSSAGLWLIGIFIPLLNFVIYWKYSHLLEDATDGKRDALLIFILFIVLFPAAIYVVQKDLNELE